MPVLPNPRHELFAQETAKGKSGRDAYRAAGFVTKTDQVADVGASKLLRHAKVAARIKELLESAADKAGVTAERVIAELAKIGFADIRQVVSWRPEETLVESEEDGAALGKVRVSRVLVLDSATLTDETAGAIAEVSQGANGSLRVKMHDKPGALEKLGRTLGIFKDKVELAGEVRIERIERVIVDPKNRDGKGVRPAARAGKV